MVHNMTQTIKLLDQKHPETGFLAQKSETFNVQMLVFLVQISNGVWKSDYSTTGQL